jgi:hypothetical protein
VRGASEGVVDLRPDSEPCVRRHHHRGSAFADGVDDLSVVDSLPVDRDAETGVGDVRVIAQRIPRQEHLAGKPPQACTAASR